MLGPAKGKNKQTRRRPSLDGLEGQARKKLKMSQNSQEISLIEVDGRTPLKDENEEQSISKQPDYPSLKAVTQKQVLSEQEVQASSSQLEVVLLKPTKPSIKLPNQVFHDIVVTRGVDRMPVDPNFSKFESAQVLEVNKCFYSVTLSQADIAQNNNKFFILQIVSIKDSEDLFLFMRWGRVGVTGQVSEQGPFSRKQVIQRYHTKVRQKIRNGKYKVVEVSHRTQKVIDVDEYLELSEKPQSKLDQRVQELIQLIFDFKMMDSQMKETGYDDRRSPLGLLAKTNIDRGYTALQKLLNVLKSPNISKDDRKQKLKEASSQFYSAIPHDFGFINMQAFVLDTEDKIQKKLELLASLSQIGVCSRLMRQNGDANTNQIDAKYEKLRTKIDSLPKGTRAYGVIMRYIENTHGKTHDKYTIHVIDIFKVSRAEEEAKFNHNVGNIRLLWHGSRLTNYVGILSEGLKIAPEEAPITGYMFGKGIYFADMVSKSANYCLPSRTNNIGLLLLCEVACGKMNEKYSSDFNAHMLAEGKHSTHGVGQYAPTSGQFLDCAWVPNMEVKATTLDTRLHYNEFVIYNREQIRCKYLVKIKFNFK